MLYKTIKNKENIKNIIHNTRYVSTVVLDDYKLRLTKHLNSGIVKVTRVNTSAGKQAIFTPEESQERIKQRRRDKYKQQVSQYKKDIDKSLSIKSKNKLVEATKKFYSEHYQFNYFLSLQDGLTIDKRDRNIAKTSDGYHQLRNQDKYQIARAISLQSCIQRTEKYIQSLVKNGKPIYDNYYYVVHKSHYDNSYHAHIAINIIDTTIANVHTYLQNRWHYSTRKKQMVKKVYDIKECIGYMNEEKKRLNAEEVYAECNINKCSNRLVTQSDLVDDINYSLKTYTHPQTQNKLKRYGIIGLHN
ncbi:hypothetical protein [Sphingobacterium paludis]|uniref:Uncharacterized protein n=1 Tax=Sphingobacterium paludis TaxID=1476465 RepID=A0A4R7D322_9SPHI|nr:hypothetical protein [Sphingobacterium paludis]TDS14827.1 hypothetical protein B0I21_103327 [Sphingobacterium paludis]